MGHEITQYGERQEWGVNQYDDMWPTCLNTFIQQSKCCFYISDESRHLNLLSILVENLYLARHEQFKMATVIGESGPYFVSHRSSRK
jgi:hypothetical protein